MRDLHESVAPTAKEMLIKQSDNYRLRMEKFECLSPKGTFNIDLINESLNSKGEVTESSTYNFFMTKEELQTLAYGLTA